MIGTTISHYKILERLGQGGMGVVYRAEDTKLGRPVALKFLPTHLLGDEDVRKRFEREARAAAALQHPNICTVYEIDDVDGQTFIAMAFVDGAELAKRIEAGPIEIDILIDIGLQIATGLEEAHSKGVVHRDIKPANIMETKSAQAVLMDFGLAQLGEAESKLTKEGTTLGTSSYMSPEQTTGAALDRRTDIWALGVVLYEMATGLLPFRGHFEQAVLYSIMNEPPEPISSLRDGIPAELERIVDKCLAKRTEERYQNAASLIADLKALEAKRRSGEAGHAVAETELPSIAVLPFENRSHGDEDEYFSDGISEDIISALAKVKGLKVTPRTLAFQFKGKRPLPEEVGRTLRVRHVLEGTVRRSGDRVRITVELLAIDGRFQLWSERYDRVMDDIFEIQDDISRSIVEQLRIKLVGDGDSELGRRSTVSVDAYNLCLQGRYHWWKRTPEAILKAIQCYELALDKDPNYALANAGLGDCYFSVGFYGVLPPKDAALKAEAAALKAVQSDPTLAQAHSALGVVRALNGWDWTAGLQSMRRAIELDPTDPKAHYYLSFIIAVSTGRLHEAYAESSRAAEVDPVAPLVSVMRAIMTCFQRQPDLAIEDLKQTLELDPDYPWTHFVLGLAYLQKRDYARAIEALDRGGLPQYREGYLGYAYAVSGQQQEARRLIEELKAGSRPKPVVPFQLALIHLGLGELADAFECLRESIAIGSMQAFWIGIDPTFDGVRDDPRFKDILRRMNLAA